MFLARKYVPGVKCTHTQGRLFFFVQAYKQSLLGGLALRSVDPSKFSQSLFLSFILALSCSIAGQKSATVTADPASPHTYTRAHTHLWPWSYLVFLPKYGWQATGAQWMPEKRGKDRLILDLEWTTAFPLTVLINHWVTVLRWGNMATH